MTAPHRSAPKGVTIGGRKFQVQLNRAPLDEFAIRQGYKDGLFGLTDHTNFTITLNPDNGDGRMKDTLMHELLHALLNLTGLDRLLSEDEDEQVANRLAPALLGFLRDKANRAAVDYLLS